MQVKNASPARVARRAQVVQAYVALVAEEGYDAATFARLAERAGLSSTRLISYHFADKDDVVAAALGEIYARIGAHLAEATTPTGIGDYVRLAVGLNTTLGPEMRALADTFLRHRPAAGRPVYAETQEDTAVGRVVAIVTRGQREGTVRTDLDPLVVATTVQRSVDALPFTLQLHPDLDLDHWAEQLVSLFERGTAP